MKRVLFVLLALALLASPIPAAEPAADVQFQRLLQRTATATEKLQFTQFFGHILRAGADMGPGDGWFKPSESRYSWKWLMNRHGGKERIELKDFTGPKDLFTRLDRNRDGALTNNDFDWPPSDQFQRQMQQATQWLRLQSDDGKLTRDDWVKLFDKVAQGKDYLNAEDVRALLNPAQPPAAPSSQPRKPGPGDGPPSKLVLIQGLMNGELGSMFEGPKLGQRGPDFTLPTHDGKKTVTLSNYRGKKPVVLIFGSFT